MEVEQTQIDEVLGQLGTAPGSSNQTTKTVKVLDTYFVPGGGGAPQSEGRKREKAFAKPSKGASGIKQDESPRPRNGDSDSHSQARIRYVRQARLDADLAKLQALSATAMDGNTAALDELRVALDQCPHIWRRLADLQHSIECKLADQIAEKDLLKLEAIRKRSSELRSELTKGSSSLIVAMAASRFVSSWIYVQYLELRSLSMEPSQNCTKSLLQAERRVATAMRALLLAKTAEIQQRHMEVSRSK